MTRSVRIPLPSRPSCGYLGGGVGSGSGDRQWVAAAQRVGHLRLASAAAATGCGGGGGSSGGAVLGFGGLGLRLIKAGQALES